MADDDSLNLIFFYLWFIEHFALSSTVINADFFTGFVDKINFEFPIMCLIVTFALSWTVLEIFGFSNLVGVFVFPIYFFLLAILRAETSYMLIWIIQTPIWPSLLEQTRLFLFDCALAQIGCISYVWPRCMLQKKENIYFWQTLLNRPHKHLWNFCPLWRSGHAHASIMHARL